MFICVICGFPSVITLCQVNQALLLALENAPSFVVIHDSGKGGVTSLHGSQSVIGFQATSGGAK